ncbi:NAD(P)-dependent oxidoreductase [Tabrizicola sp. BL-A-41-H6]|uniref:NAD(P)-dependent oxidoreductase n=1 Tax=Tabrizicola sp. BL-A-41-H6 TaxID=3421107 RepID=UPI003D67CCBA
MSVEKKVGLVGLGIMGGAIAPNLMAAGYHVIGFDVDPARRDAMAAVGVGIAASIGDLVAEVDTLLTSLPHEGALDTTVRAILAAGTPRRTIVEMSTLKVDAKIAAHTALAAGGHILLDCPLSGTGAQARTRDLTVYASGDSAAIAACADIFAGFAKASFDLGAIGNGSKMKYVANLLVFIHNVAAAEALVLGMKAGLDPQQIVDVVKLGAGGSRMLEVRGPMMASGNYKPVTAGFPMYYKDLGIIGQFAMDLDCPTPLLSASLPIYLAGGGSYPDADVSAVCAVLETMAGLTRGG